MTKVTDRLSDSALVAIAKQQYEQKQKSKMPTNIVHLTSKGLVYPESHPLRAGYVNMRSMSAYDEDIITNESLIKDGTAFDVLLAELIVDDINILDIADCDKDGLIINARILGYGSSYPSQVIDPKANKLIDVDINLSELATTEFKLTPDSLGEFLYTVEETGISFKFKFKNGKSKLDESKPSSSLLFNTITEVNGDRSLAAIENFIKYEFSPKHSREFRKFYAENSPRIITEVTIEGESGDTFSAGFRLGTDLFWF